MTESRVTVTINGKGYPMACAAGEEQRILGLGERIDSIVKDIAASSGSIADTRLLVMASLILTDQLVELESRLSAVPAAAEQQQGAGQAASEQKLDEAVLVQTLSALAERLENLASQSH